jgi:hypothetical protein
MCQSRIDAESAAGAGIAASICRLAALPLRLVRHDENARRRTRTGTPQGLQILSLLRLPFRQAGKGNNVLAGSSIARDIPVRPTAQSANTKL